jgi:hypothetical protein
LENTLRDTNETVACETEVRPTNLLKWSSLAALLLVAFYLGISLYIAGHRLFWFDEVTTVLISRMPDTAALVKLLKSGVDQQPITFYFVVRFFEHLFGPSEWAARLPSALALAAGLLVTFDCARRLTDNLHGLLAIALLTCSVLPLYGFEARPYGLYYMWSACSLWLWIHTRQQSRGAAVLFGLSICASLATHYYAVFCLIPYAAIVVLDGKQAWRSPKFLAGILGAVITLGLFAPLAVTHRQFSSGFWALPTMGALSSVYSQSFPQVSFALALAIVWMALGAPRTGSSVMASSERLAWLFVLIPLGGFVIARLVTNAFHPRYFVGMLPGIAIGFACFMWRQFRSAAFISVGFVCIFVGVGVAKSVAQAAHPEMIGSVSAPDEAFRLRTLLKIEPELFNQERKQFVVVMSSDILALEIFHYSRYPEGYVFLREPQPTSVDIGLTNFSHVYPIRFWNLDDLKEHASQSAFIDPPLVMLQLLRHQGVNVDTIRSIDPLRVVYLR